MVKCLRAVLHRRRVCVLAAMMELRGAWPEDSVWRAMWRSADHRRNVNVSRVAIPDSSEMQPPRHDPGPRWPRPGTKGGSLN